MKSIRILPYLLCAAAPALHANTVTATGDVTPMPAPPAYWRIDGTTLQVGNTGTGSLSMTDGGEVYVDNAGAKIGVAVDGIGAITVDGTGSTFEVAQSLNIGESGQGKLTVSASGIAIVHSETVLGKNASGVGEAIVTGAGSIWRTGSFTVGSNGSGKLTISAGGKVASGLSGIGLGAGSTGEVLVTGAGSTWESDTYLYLGSEGRGKLTVSDGARVERSTTIVGSSAGGSGELTVTGTNSIFDVGSALTIGDGGQASLTISNGGTVSAENAFVSIASSGTGSLNIGDYEMPSTAGTLSTMEVTFGSNGGVVNFNQTNATTFAAKISGPGQVKQRGSGTTTLTGANDYTGATTVELGTLVVNGSISASEITVKDGGTLGGTGTLGDITLENGGRLSPGNSIGTLSGKSLTWEDGGMLVFELGAATGDKIVLTEGLWRSGLNNYSFEFIDAGWHVGHTYTLAAFDQTDFTADDFSFTNSGGFEGEFTTNGEELRFTLYSVPEPSTWAMVMASIIVIAVGLRRRRY